VPDATEFPLALGSQLPNKKRSEALFPIAYRLVCEGKSTYQKEFSDIAVAEFVAKSAEESLKNDVSGNFQKIEGSASPFVEGATTVAAAVDLIAQGGGALELDRAFGLTVRAVHGKGKKLLSCRIRSD